MTYKEELTSDFQDVMEEYREEAESIGLYDDEKDLEEDIQSSIESFEDAIKDADRVFTDKKDKTQEMAKYAINLCITRMYDGANDAQDEIISSAIWDVKNIISKLV